MDTTKGTQQAKPIDTKVKTKEQGTIKSSNQVLEPPKSTTDITRDVNHKGKAKVEEDIPRTSQNALKPQLEKGKGKLEETSEKPLPRIPCKSQTSPQKLSRSPTKAATNQQLS